jgi:hypothetical protein
LRIGFRNKARRGVWAVWGEDGGSSWEGRAPEECLRRGGVCSEAMGWLRRWQTA